MSCTVVLTNGWPIRCAEEDLAFNMDEKTIIVRGVPYPTAEVASLSTPYFTYEV